MNYKYDWGFIHPTQAEKLEYLSVVQALLSDSEENIVHIAFESLVDHDSLPGFLTWSELQPIIGSFLSSGRPPYTAPADFNGDHKSDILWRNDFGAVVVWTMNGAALSTSGEIVPAGSLWSVAAIADLDGDHRADFALFDPTIATLT